MEAEPAAEVEVAAHGRPLARALVEAAGPVELLHAGCDRDAVRLLVTAPDGVSVGHARFLDLPDLLDPGDVLVVNDSATLPAALEAELDGSPLRLHISSPVPATRRRLVELRVPQGLGSAPFASARVGDVVGLPGGGRARLLAPRLRSGRPSRLWEAELALPVDLHAYLRAHGEPIRYGYVSRAWGIASYQTIFARAPGSSEMPSAGRPFSSHVLRRLRVKGVFVEPLTLHAGVASLERGEQPTPEPFRIPPGTASRVNAALLEHRRVIAVGTTVVRALETGIDGKGRVQATEGVTGLIVRPGREVRSVTGLLTGFHEPEASHFELLEAVAGENAVRRSYAAAVEEGYAWHEFGDVHLLTAPDA